MALFFRSVINIQNIKEVYITACESVYAPSILRALKHPKNISDEIKTQLRRDSFQYLEDGLDKLFNMS
ncbi:hypothetical protein BKG95_02835 [Rodentibacter pneumotropicus]|uniref:Uncharacterized protein n=2 Tax=Rodentibacter pneumotropicus TaxID=758 RepID=A0A1V3K5L8_9PAST|nr:hypothetical protein BKG95_02835 [Rodentibacter pneumotropicus]THA09843.1 hypothetical protein D3M78_05065 [Rodentibacter pneumotropicus]